MIIFVVNCGSSSIKYQLLNMNGEQVLAKGLIERIGMEGSVLKHTPTGKYTVDISAEIPDHSVGIQMALDALTNEEYGVIDSMDEIDAVGHRVVHGGERFTDSVLISDDVLNGIEACAEIAPLHNPPNLYGIKACMRLMYNTPQVAVFDTAFHQTMPKVAYLYGLPYEMYVKYGLRRYGFHGTSHKYVAQQAAEMMGETCVLLPVIWVMAPALLRSNMVNPLIPAWGTHRWKDLSWVHVPARSTLLSFLF